MSTLPRIIIAKKDKKGLSSSLPIYKIEMVTGPISQTYCDISVREKKLHLKSLEQRLEYSKCSIMLTLSISCLYTSKPKYKILKLVRLILRHWHT